MKKRSIAILLMTALCISLCSCGGAAQNSGVSGQTSHVSVVAERPSFWSGEAQTSSELQPKVAAYTVAEDFSNVINYADFYGFTESALQMLLQNGFVVMDGYNEEFFGLYEMNRYSLIPSFITTDSLMHTYHLFFSRLLKGVEKQHFIPDLLAVSQTMQQESLAQYEALKGTEWENAAKRNVAFFSVALSLLQPGAETPEIARDAVAQELSLIQQASEIAESPVINSGGTAEGQLPLQEDYTQYIPRGYYTASEDLTNYFKAMMWYGRLTFRQSDEDQSRSALLLTTALENSEALKQWDEIYTITSFFVGASDDAGIYEYAPLVTEAYGGWPELKSLPKQTEQWKAFTKALSTLEAPVINSIPIFDETVQPDQDEAIEGFRFMGQRFTLDASVFQQLVYRAVKENSEGERRMLPSALDLPSALGSQTAQEILTSTGVNDYENYSEHLQKLQSYFADAPDALWTGSLYGGWLNTLRPLTTEKGEGWPQFMQNKAWSAKSLNTFLGSWTELKHDTVLYAKQVYAEMGGGPMEERDDRGYVEPEPTLYGRLAALSEATADGLQRYGVLSEADQESLGQMASLAKQLAAISEKELQDQVLDDAEYDLIRTFGGQLEHFWYEALKDEKNGEEITTTDFPAAVITDVATDPNGSVLEVGSGYVDDLYVIVNVDGQLRIAHGGVYSFYEFQQPLSGRLTDENWRQMLGIDVVWNDDGTWQDNTVEIPRPDWTSLFRVDRNYG